MELVAADWLKSGKREDNLGSRSGGIVQVFINNLLFMFIIKACSLKKMFIIKVLSQFTYSISDLAETCARRIQQIFLHCEYAGALSISLITAYASTL